MPLIVWSLSWLLPPIPAVKLGVFMVLLAPCTDWFVTFTHLGKGSTRLAVAMVPIQLLVQFILLPFYLWLLMGKDFIQAVAFGPFVQVFIWIILAPFILAALTRLLAAHRSIGTRWLALTASLPVPLLALVLFFVATSQAIALGNNVTSLGWAALVFVLFLIIAPFLARVVAVLFRMEPEAGRTLAFNVSTRNSFIVLPLALVLPAGWESAAAVIVLQTFIELSVIIVYLWLIPNHIFPTKRHKQPL